MITFVLRQQQLFCTYLSYTGNEGMHRSTDETRSSGATTRWKHPDLFYLQLYGKQVRNADKAPTSSTMVEFTVVHALLRTRADALLPQSSPDEDRETSYYRIMIFIPDRWNGVEEQKFQRGMLVIDWRTGDVQTIEGEHNMSIHVHDMAGRSSRNYSAPARSQLLEC